MTENGSTRPIRFSVQVHEDGVSSSQYYEMLWLPDRFLEALAQAVALEQHDRQELRGRYTAADVDAIKARITVTAATVKAGMAEIRSNQRLVVLLTGRGVDADTE